MSLCLKPFPSTKFVAACPNFRLARIVIAVLVTGLACDAPPPFFRLVDPGERSGAVSIPDSLMIEAPSAASSREVGASMIPTATIDHDTRHVLAAHPHHVVAVREGMRATEPNLVMYEAPMTGFFPDAQSLLINARAFVIGDGDWRILPPMLRPLKEVAGEQMLELELALEGVPEGTIAHLWLDAYQLPPTGGTRYVSSARTIPKFSKLEFAFGIMQAAVSQGLVRFSVSACDGDDCESLFVEVFDPAQQTPLTWQDRSVSLATVWGQTRELKFEAVPERAEARSLPVWANPRVVRESSDTASPNVILLSIDTLRRDHLSVYGYERETTPFINTRLAADGAVFDNLIAEAATTEASHMTLFTSLPALVHGVTNYDEKLAVPVVTLAEAFRKEGFATAAFTEAGPLDPRLGFKIGFDQWKENPNLHFLFPTGQVERIFAQAWDWIAQQQDQPFFLFLHTFQVHHPLSPPFAYRSYFLDDKIELSEEYLAIARYDQEIRYVDDQLETFWNKLQKYGYAQNTILAVISDHGDEFWEHGERGHASLPYEEVLGVPLVLIGPTVAKGFRSQQSLHHLDLMPTLLDLAGLPTPQHVLGESFADSARGAVSQSGTQAPRRIRTSAAWRVPGGVSIPVFAIRDGDFKIIRYNKGSERLIECFDLETDSEEALNLCAEGPTEEATRLLAHLDAYESRMQTEKRSLLPEELEAVETQTVPLSPEHEAQLRALGYVK